MTIHVYASWEISVVENKELAPWDAKVLVAVEGETAEVVIFRARSTRSITILTSKLDKMLASWHEQLTKVGYKVVIDRV